MQDQELDELLRRTMEPPPSAGVTAAAVDLAERAKAAAHAAPAASKSRPWFPPADHCGQHLQDDGHAREPGAEKWLVEEVRRIQAVIATGAVRSALRFSA